MKPTVPLSSCLAVFGWLLFFALALGQVGCQDAVWVLPEDGSVKQGPFDIQVYWGPDMVPSTLQVALNDEDVTGSMVPASSVGISSTFEIAGVMGMIVNPFPGKKLLSAQMLDVYGLPYSATSVFTATSTTARVGFAGGLMVFECTDSFMNSPLQIPGFDLDLGISEGICTVLPISGVFPAGNSSFPVQSDPLPVLYGIFPQQVTYDEDDTVPNGISLSPVEMALSFDFDPADPKAEGKLCRASFVMEGTIMPVPPAVSSLYHGAMVQTLKEVSLSLVSGGECEAQFTSSADVDFMTFNYLARK